MAGAAALGVLGIIPIPVEITRNICEMERERVYNPSWVHVDGFGNGSVVNVFESGGSNVSLLIPQGNSSSSSSSSGIEPAAVSLEKVN